MLEPGRTHLRVVAFVSDNQMMKLGNVVVSGNGLDSLSLDRWNKQPTPHASSARSSLGPTTHRQSLIYSIIPNLPVSKLHSTTLPERLRPNSRAIYLSLTGLPHVIWDPQHSEKCRKNLSGKTREAREWSRASGAHGLTCQRASRD
jgi:hypothetical protein